MTNLEMVKNLVPDTSNEFFEDSQYSAFLSLKDLDPSETYTQDKEIDLMLCLADICDSIDRKKHQLVKAYTKGQISKSFYGDRLGKHMQGAEDTL